MTQIHHTELPQATIAWTEDGPDTGIPLVLFQRFRGTMDDWDPAFIAEIAKDRRVIRFDNAGIGRSTGEVPGSIAGIAAVAAEFVAQFGPVDVLGWSLGGVVAQEMTLQAPHLVRRLIVAGSSPGGITDGPQAHPRVPQVMTRATNSNEDFLFLFYPETEAATASGRASLARIQAQARGPEVSAQAFMAQVQAISTWPGVIHRASEFRLPLLVANGAHDVMLPAYRSYVLSQQAPDAKLVLYPDAGHAFLFQHIPDFAAEIDRFLA